MPRDDVEVRCGDCGKDLSDVIDADTPGNKKACPKCGSTTREIRKILDENVPVEPHFSGLGRREGQAFAFRESPRRGLASTADRHQDGSVSFALDGDSPQGEEDTLASCRILVEALNLAGADWGEPREDDGVVDCCAHDRRDDRTLLSIQVVRAIVDQNLWRQLNNAGEVERNRVEIGQLVTHLKEAIESKANDRVIPKASRHGLTLALDATRLPGVAFNAVAEAVRLQLGAWIVGLGFAGVWLVGPTATLTSRLDVARSESQDNESFPEKGAR